MFNRLIRLSFILAFIAPLYAQAQQLVPIAVGDITIFIPIGNTPVVEFKASAESSNQGSSVTLTWEAPADAEPGTSYEVTITAPDGTVTTQRLTGFSLSIPLTQVGEYNFTIETCLDNECSGPRTVVVTATPVSRKVVFLHTDALGSPAAETNENGGKQ